MLGPCILLSWKEQETQRQNSINISHLLEGTGSCMVSNKWWMDASPSFWQVGQQQAFVPALPPLTNATFFRARSWATSLFSGLIPPHARKNPVSEVVKNITILYIASPLHSSWIKQGKLFRLPLLHSFNFKKLCVCVCKIQLPPNCSWLPVKKVWT